MSVKLTILLQGASSAGKSQLVCWHTTNKANADTQQTIEESHEFLEDFQGKKILVEILDTGGDSNYVSLLEDWVSKANAQLLVLNLEDKTSVDYLKEHQPTLISGNVLVRIVIGNLPSGKQEKRVVSKYEATELAASFGSKVLYLETNTRTGDGVNNVFATLLESVYGASSVKAEAKTNTAMTVHIGSVDKDAEILLLKTRQQELESRLMAQEASFSLRLQSLESKLFEISAAYHKVQEQALAARVEALEARFHVPKSSHEIEEQALSKSFKASAETETPMKSKPVKQSNDSIKQGLFTNE